jgi:hypothetical protein
MVAEYFDCLLHVMRVGMNNLCSPFAHWIVNRIRSRIAGEAVHDDSTVVPDVGRDHGLGRREARSEGAPVMSKQVEVIEDDSTVSLPEGGQA